MKDYEAHYYKKGEGSLQCELCPHNCIIKDGREGICGVRSNRDGTLYADSYGMLTAIAMDPIEKKPLYHFHPATQILSLGSYGCNLKCPFCQNWNISQETTAASSYYSPQDIIVMAKRNDSQGIAYTYNEPVIWAEYVIDTSRLASEKGLYNVMVTNGYVNEGTLRDLIQTVDAFNIDLKSFREETYKRVMKADLESVKNTIRRVYDEGRHLEVTTLIVTGMNDSMDEMKDIMKFLSSIDKSIPWHISRYYPSYHYTSEATDVDFIFNVYEEAEKYLNYVYCGNVHGSLMGTDTICPQCKTVAVKRRGYFIEFKNLDNGVCAKCGHDLNFRM